MKLVDGILKHKLKNYKLNSIRNYFEVISYNKKTKELIVHLTDRHAFLQEWYLLSKEFLIELDTELIELNIEFIDSNDKKVRFKNCKLVKEVCGFGSTLEHVLILKGNIFKGKAREFRSSI